MRGSDWLKLRKQWMIRKSRAAAPAYVLGSHHAAPVECTWMVKTTDWLNHNKKSNIFKTHCKYMSIEMEKKTY